MFFLLSGEGPTDIGSLDSEGHFTPGPMALLVDQIVESHWYYSILETDDAVRFVSESELAKEAEVLKAIKKSIGLPGLKVKKETRYFFNNARLLAKIAIRLEVEYEREVVAILFRDSDGTASAGRGLWQDKRESMLAGFKEEVFERGVPMIPKPKSEAWLICAFKEQPYQNCPALENRSGNDHSPNSLKGELNTILSEQANRQSLCDAFNDKNARFERIAMPSFRAFLERLETVMVSRS